MSKLSVLMTTLNSAKFLQPAIESILGQTYHNYEFIIVDGGSKDGTISIIKTYNDDRIKLYIKEGIRRSAQLNFGIEKSISKFVAIIDSDDIALPDRLHEQLKFLNKNKDIKILGSWAYLISENEENIKILRRPIDNKNIIKNILQMNGISFPTICFSKDVAIKFNENLEISEDLDWFFRLRNKVNFANLARPLMKLRQTKLSRSRIHQIEYSPLFVSLKKSIEEVQASNQKYKDLGLINYYYGRIPDARNFFLKSLLSNPFDFIHLRYTIPLLLLPNFLWERLKKNKFFLLITSSYRNIIVMKSLLHKRK